MVPVQIVALLVRLVSIVIVVDTVRYSAATIANDYFPSSTALWLTVGAIIALFTLAGILWFFPLTIATGISTFDSDQPVERWSGEQLYEFGFVMLGVYLLTRAGGDLIYWVLYLLSAGFEGLGAEHTVSLWVRLIELALALILILGAKGLRRLLFTIKQ
jgi:hypothetical protein